MTAATFTRASVAHKLDGSQVASGAPRYETGLSGQAIMVEEGTTNLCTPEQALCQGGWGVDGAGDATVIQNAPGGGMTITTNSLLAYERYAEISLPPATFPQINGQTITFAVTVEMLGPTPPSGRVLVEVYTHSGSYTSSEVSVTAGGRVTLSRSVPAAPTSTTLCRVSFESGTPAGTSIRVTSAQIEAKPYATSYIGGTRADEALTVPFESLVPNPAGDWTIEAVFSANRPGAYRLFDAWPWLYFGYTPESKPIVIWVEGGVLQREAPAVAAVVSPQDFHCFAVRRLGQTLALFFDGVRVAGVTDAVLDTAPPADFLLGSWGYPINGLVDRVRGYDRALSDTEIANLYEWRGL